jgi:hypothetical protein
LYNDGSGSYDFGVNLIEEFKKERITITNDPEWAIIPWARGPETDEIIDKAADDLMAGDSKVIFLLATDHSAADIIRALYKKGARQGEFVIVGSFWAANFGTLANDYEFTEDELLLATGTLQFFQSYYVGEMGEWYHQTGSEMYPQWAPPDRWGAFYYDSVH